MTEIKNKLSAALPKDRANGLSTTEAERALTDGFVRDVRHVAVVELYVSSQAEDNEGAITNTARISRIELVQGVSAEQATKILADTFTARTDTPLDVFQPEIPSIFSAAGADEGIEARDAE